MNLVRDAEGAISFGLVETNVYVSRFTGKLSGRLGAAHLNDLQQALEAGGGASVTYFVDASELVSFDMLARSAFVRFLLRHRKRFSEIVVLNWVSGASAGGQSLAATVGEPVLMLEDRHEFEHRLVSAAPRAAQLIRASGSHAIAAEVGGANKARRATRG
jgi:hypothetical protein